MRASSATVVESVLAADTRRTELLREEASLEVCARFLRKRKGQNRKKKRRRTEISREEAALEVCERFPGNTQKQRKTTKNKKTTEKMKKKQEKRAAEARGLCEILEK